MVSEYLLTWIIKIVWNFSSDVNFILIQRLFLDYLYRKADLTQFLFQHFSY